MSTPVDRRRFDPFAPPPPQNPGGPGPGGRHDPPPHQGPGDDQVGAVNIPDPREVAKMRKTELVELAGNLGLDTTGTRDELLERIDAHVGQL